MPKERQITLKRKILLMNLVKLMSTLTPISMSV